MFTGIRLAGRQLKNRIVFGPIRSNRAADHVLGDWHRAYYGERAKGGAGMIVTEAGMVIAGDYPYEKAVNVWAPGAAAGYQNIADTLHPYGCLAIAQLGHFGGQAVSGMTDRELWAPSAVPEVNSGEVPKVMEAEDIEAVIDAFARAASLVCGTDMDGVEINAGQFSLLRQFLSPLTNFRGDDYGGTLENRARLCCRVLLAVRKSIGSQQIMGLRLCGDEFAPWGGLTPEQCAEIARYLEDQTSPDYITVELGSIYSAHMTLASMRVPLDYGIAAAQTIRSQVKAPVCATGSIAGRDWAEGLIKAGIDLVEMTRPLNADPRLPVKYSGELAEKIRPCIFCNQGCYTHLNSNPPFSCAMNPLAGREREYQRRLQPARWQKKVLVVGGGPAGLAAAATAAGRGHRVVLWEKEPACGGRLALAAKIPGNSGFRLGIDHLLQEALDQGVEIRMGANFTLQTLVEETPEAVILAAGSRPGAIEAAVEADAVIWRPEEILANPEQIRGHVLVADLEGSWSGLATAVFLAGQADSVQIISPDFFIAAQLAAKGEFMRLYGEAISLGIQFRPQAEVIRIARDHVQVRDKFSRQEETIRPLDSVVLSVARWPANDLYQDLLGRGIEVYAVGDCVAPRNYGSAVREGFIAATGI